jgi:hypothetical protein
LVATREYPPLLTSYWSQQGNILHCSPPIGRNKRIFSINR